MIFYIKAPKYLRYRKVFLDKKKKQQKNRVFIHKKIQNMKKYKKKKSHKNFS